MARRKNANLCGTVAVVTAPDGVTHREPIMEHQEPQPLETRPPIQRTGGMCCPRCGCYASRVTDTKPAWRGIRRYRTCFDCGRHWSTLEAAPQPDPR